MPIYEEKRKINGKSRYYIRTYVKDERGVSRQITKHNPQWIGRDGKLLAMQEESRIKNSLYEYINPKLEYVSLRILEEEYMNYISSKYDTDTINTKRGMLNHYCQKDITEQVETFPDRDIKKVNIKYHEKWQSQLKVSIYPKVSSFDENYRLEWKKPASERKYVWKNYSIKYLNDTQKEISNMFDYAVSNGYLAENPLKKAKKIGTPKEIKFSRQQKKHEVITIDEKEKLMKVTNNDIKFNTLFDLWFSRGPRPGEIRAFRVKDYDCEKAQLMVNHTLSKKNVLKEPKTPSSKAPIDLGERLNEKMKKYVELLKEKEDFNENWYLFGNKNTPISSHCLEYNRDKFFDKANIKTKITLHEFRHSCATWLYSIGTPMIVISKILRHTDMSVTMQVYTHLLKDDYENVIANLG